MHARWNERLRRGAPGLPDGDAGWVPIVGILVLVFIIGWQASGPPYTGPNPHIYAATDQ